MVVSAVIMGCHVPLGEPVTNLISFYFRFSQVSGDGDGVVNLLCFPLGKMLENQMLLKNEKIECNYDGSKRTRSY